MTDVQYWSNSRQEWKDISTMSEQHTLNAIGVLRRKAATVGLTEGEKGERKQLEALVARADDMAWGTSAKPR